MRKLTRYETITMVILCSLTVNCNQKEVEEIFPSQTVEQSGTLKFSDSHTSSFGLDRIDEHEITLDKRFIHRGTGKGVTVYVFDGGIANHPEIEGRLRVGFNGFPDEERVCNPHGVAVASAIAGTILGVAPEADIVDVKMFECRRMRGALEAIVKGSDWVIEDHAKHRGHRAVVNWSFIADTLGNLGSLDSAVIRLTHAGIPVVVSAGNSEMDACRISPANSPWVLSVGSSRIRIDTLGHPHDMRTIGTAFGPCVSLYAPGDSVLMASFFGLNHQPSEQLFSGTSMSAGYASGALALLLEENPRLTPQEVIKLLRDRATKNIILNTYGAAGSLLYVGIH